MKQKLLLLYIRAMLVLAGVNFGCVTSPQESTPLTELEAKAYLVEKYNPGICFGMPSPLPPDYVIKEVISQDSNLVNFIKEKFNLFNDHDVYVKLEQFWNTNLTKNDNGYNFTLVGGNCCSIHTYKGKVTIKEQKITDELIEHSTDNVPC